MTRYTGNTITKAWIEYISFVPHNWYMALWKLTNYPPHLRMENRMKAQKLSHEEVKRINLYLIKLQTGVALYKF